MNQLKNNENNHLSKSDLETILQVNNKAIEIQNDIAEQYENIVDNTDAIVKSIDNIDNNISEIKKEMKDINKEQYRMMILLSSGIISLIVQIITMLYKK